jgi:hypothetical protein
MVLVDNQRINTHSEAIIEARRVSDEIDGKLEKQSDKICAAVTVVQTNLTTEIGKSNKKISGLEKACNIATGVIIILGLLATPFLARVINPSQHNVIVNPAPVVQTVK